MSEMRDALLRLVRAWIRTNRVLEAYIKVNVDSNLLFQTCGEIEEAICLLVGEAEKDLEESVTHVALTAPFISDDRRVEILMGKYRENHPVMPAPFFFSRDEMRESVKQNGGYLYEAPEGGGT